MATTTPTIYEVIRADHLTFDSLYQRAVNPAHVAKIVRSFDPKKLGVVTVSLRANGATVVVDGQHRAIACRSLRDDYPVPCAVYDGLSLADEAMLFTDLQRSRKSLTPGEIFRADLVAGDPEALAIKRIVSECGYALNLNGGYRSGLSAFAKVREIYRRDRGETLRRVLRIMQGAWGEDVSPRQRTISGTAILVGRYGDELDAGRMADQLKTVTQRDVELRGEVIAHSYRCSNPEGVARHMHALYNDRRRTNRLPDWPMGDL